MRTVRLWAAGRHGRRDGVMDQPLPVVYLARHGETAWSLSGQHTARTCELAGFGARAEVDRDLLEWDYGQYEGRRSAEIHAERPDWQLFRDGCPGGESPEQVRVRAAHWLGLEAGAGRYFLLSTASLSALGYEHNRSQPAIRLWNDTDHVEV